MSGLEAHDTELMQACVMLEMKERCVVKSQQDGKDLIASASKIFEDTERRYPPKGINNVG